MLLHRKAVRRQRNAKNSRCGAKHNNEHFRAHYSLHVHRMSTIIIVIIVIEKAVRNGKNHLREKQTKRTSIEGS
jgi:hypothetical protein